MEHIGLLSVLIIVVPDDVFVTFCLHIHLHEGLGLEVHDTCGSSDPYIKCQYGGKTIYKSEIIFRELNPKWNEKFSFLIQDPTEIITFKVFDFDRFMRDDFMGTANVSLNTLKLSEKTQFKLKLEDPKMQEINIRPLGYLIVSMTLTPINEEQKELFIERSIRGIVSERKGKQEIQKDEQTKNENIIKNNNYCSFIEEFNGNIENQLYKKYNFLSSFHSFEDVGFLIFKIFEAEGLAALDVNGKSDPFCVLELCNFRLQTHTEYKTLCPKWNCFFKLPIKDVHQIIELTVYDEDPNKRVEFLGKIAIPLLNIFNGEKRWYMLKNKKLDGPAKGRILVEGTLYFNYFKAALKTFQPKEIKLKQPLERFKRQKFLSNANRLRSIADLILDWTKFINYCLSWKSYPISICSLMFYIIFVSLIQLWHFPFILLIILIYNFIIKYLINLLLNFERKRKLFPLLIGNWANIATINNKQKISIDNSLNSMLLETQQISLENEKLDEDNIKIQNEIKKKDGIDEQQQIIISKSLRERLQAIQETLTLLQQQGDFLVGLIDRIKG
uniref:C2 domain-containing protein n=1 Tax=Meloidogyne enterolobii TaxID=390850 RepID=A0A6V7WJH5_MELEN|nr:unnamed protein product [Meloidogyne enterolobii]